MTIISLPSKDSLACLKPNDHMEAMLRAIHSTGLFTVDLDADAGTVSAYHTKSGREVLAAIQKGEGGPWITRHHKQLFD
jgi:hypothetical protein